MIARLEATDGDGGEVTELRYTLNGSNTFYASELPALLVLHLILSLPPTHLPCSLLFVSFV